MSYQRKDVPWGIQFMQKLVDRCCPRIQFNRDLYYRSSVLFLTYIAYMCYHMSRKPISVVKAVLHQNCSSLKPPSNIPTNNNSTWCDWAPFDGSDSDATQLLGILDSAFLFAYAVAMFVSGFIAERVNLRYFLSLGMLLSGVLTYMFGIAKSYNVHAFSYFVIVQIYAGIFQTTGWPGVVTVLGNWFGKGKRGLIFGVWNSHTSIGNILGSLIAAHYVETDWSLSFIVPGLIIGLAGFLLFLFLVVNPIDVGCTPPDLNSTSNSTDSRKGRRQFTTARRLENRVANVEISGGDYSGGSSETDDTEIIIGEQEVYHRNSHNYLEAHQQHGASSSLSNESTSESTSLLKDNSLSASSNSHEKAIGFIGACKIPGVIEYSLSLFFSKLVSYTFLCWLPSIVKNFTTMGATLSADISTLFDVGGIFGAIMAGLISDYSGMSATTCVGMLAIACPTMFIYQHLGATSLGINMILLVVVGILVNGPYALITTAVSAELGTHSSLKGNSKALATVTAIIDGTGSIGAAVGPLLAGFLLSNYTYNSVFVMLIFSDLLALLLLLRLFKQEVSKFRKRRQRSRRIN